jgi:cytochrome c oxidase subunit 2
VLVAALGTLVLAAPAFGDAGLSPVRPASENADAIRTVYWVILAITGVSFVVVETLLIVFLVRYRGRGRARDVGGAQVPGQTRIEIAWTFIPIVLLAAVVAIVFVMLPDVQDAPAAGPAGSLDVKVEGHQYYWLFRYPGGQVSVDRMVVPVNKVVNLEVTSPDVIHSWWIPALGGKIDAIPGRTNTTWFKAQRTGVFKGQCAELCGIGHAWMTASVEVVSNAKYGVFLGDHVQGSDAVAKETFEGVCAKCHGLQGEGTDTAPRIVGTHFDQATVELLRRGGVKMPAVGTGWSRQQMEAVIAYLNATIGSGASG